MRTTTLIESHAANVIGDGPGAVSNAIGRGLLNIVLLILMLSSGSAALYAQNGTSILQGEITTTGPEGNVVNLAGAKTILKGTSESPQVITVIADDVGHYRFSNLVSGTYELVVTCEGFVAVKETVVIGDGQTVTQDIQLELEGVAATVTVAAESGELNTNDSTVATSISSKTLQELPLSGEKVQDALPMVPGVVRGPDGLINVKGAQSSQSGRLVGSSNADDPANGNAAIDLPIEAVESVQVVSNPYSAEFGNFNGGVVQMQTRSGSDKWKFGLTSIFPRLRKRGGSLRGIESARPRATVSGPLKKGKVFLFQSFEYRFIQTPVESLPELERDTKLESFNSFTRIDYNISDAHHLNATFALFPQKLDFFNLNTFNPQATAANLHQRGWMAAVNDQYVTAKGGIWQTTFSVKRADADVFGNSGEVFTIAPSTNSGGYYTRQHRESLRYEAQTIYSLPAFNWIGQHWLKVGSGFAHTTFDGTSVGSPVRIIRADGTVSQIKTYLGTGSLTRDKSDIGLFIQDKWTINPKITLDLGIRFDRDNLAETFNPAPRVGFVISPFADNKTIVRGGVGVFFSKIPLNVGVFEQIQNRLITRFGADGVTPVGSTLFRNALENGDIESPYSVGWNIQLDREINDRLLVRVGYEQRETNRDFILNPFSGAIEGEGIYQLGNGGSSSYRDLLVMTRLRLQANRDLYFSYTRSRSMGDLNTYGSFAGNLPNPIVRNNEYSRLAFDAPNRFLFWGDLGLPYGISLTPVIDWRNGFPFSTVDENQDFVGERNRAGRFPTFFSADFQVLKDFKVGFRRKEYTLRAGMKFFNVTNHFNPRDIQNNIDSPDFGGFYNGVGRKIRFRFEIVK